MMLAGTLPFDESSSTGTSALIQGIGIEIINVPLHTVNLKSDLVSGRVTIGVRPELPVKGVSMLLGNDLAGGKFYLNQLFQISPVVMLRTMRARKMKCFLHVS
jgi:hypothetical protein